MPPEMCAPYGADFDSDEMSLFPLKEPMGLGLGLGIDRQSNSLESFGMSGNTT